ncbi:MAG: histidine phosphatase family protein [Clostridia bacterium]|nr:histidine phosphatase family protein [Clostridia bacterium]
MMILLVRHGETDWNRQKRLQGRQNIPLCDSDREQMRRCGDALVGLTVGAMRTSPLSRATESAEILAAALSFPVDGIRAEHDLIERDCGSLDGLTQAELRVRRNQTERDETEPLYAVRERMMRTLLRVARHGNERCVVMVSHSAAIKALMARLYNKPELQRKGTHNAGISLVEYKGGRLHPRAFDLTPEEAARFLRRRGFFAPPQS